MGSSFLPWAYLLRMLIPFTKTPPPPTRAHLLTSSDLRFQHINIDSDYSHGPGTLSTADTLTGSPWFRWFSEFSGTGECLRLSLHALFSRFLVFFFLCQPDKVWKIQLMTFMTEAGWRKAEKGGIVTIRGGHLGKM